MVRLLLILVTNLGLSFSVQANDLPPCAPTLPVGTLCAEELENLRPTQPEVGWDEVKTKVKKYRGWKPRKLAEKVKEKVIPVVVGPDGLFYMVDHHHTSLAFLLVGVKQGSLKISENWSSIHPELTLNERMRKFWDRMNAEGHSWLETEAGDVVDPLSPRFPRSVRDCGDNRLRSIVYDLLQEDLLAKQDVNYYEFHVAKLLRVAKIDVNELGYSQAFKQAKDFLLKPQGRATLAQLHCRLGLGRYFLSAP